MNLEEKINQCVAIRVLPISSRKSDESKKYKIASFKKLCSFLCRRERLRACV